MNLPPRHLSSSDWQPVGVDQLERNARVVVESDRHYSVIAGPGAGKTELLAQRAAYLLQTGSSPAPQRILAISFKRDAAKNLAERVRQRCHPDHAARFDSLTFDAFAKSLVDRFGQALPDQWRPTSDYEILFTTQSFYVEFLNRTGRNQGLHNSAIRSIPAKTFERLHVLADRLPIAGLEPSSIEHWVAQQFWTEQLHRNHRSRLSFGMITRLAELLVRVNPAVRHALALTYSHVFMDEFQDTTQAQFDLVTTLFCDTPAIVTAVGDNKQQIMRWALAMDNPFVAFEDAFGATRIPLRNNYRSSPELVRMQHCLARALDAEAVEPLSQTQPSISDQCCEIWDFPSAEQEALVLARFIAHQMQAHNLEPGDFAILVRQRAADYAAVLEPALRNEGILLRNEAAQVGSQMLQELLTEPLSELIIQFLRIASNDRARTAWSDLLRSLAALRGISPEDTQGYRRQARSLERFAREFGERFAVPPQTEDRARLMVQQVEGFLGRDALLAAFPVYAQGNWINEVLNSVSLHLHASSVDTASWNTALDAYEGVNCLQLMTLHKSKGLEYHTVIFVGLDDSAWWSYRNDETESTAGFFVAFTRAEQRVIFTYSADRGVRNEVAPLYRLLQEAGVRRTVFA